ncbi:MAG: hypothetical protein ACLGI9_20960 [Thermoanaerobaculia bacterium]
MARESYLVTITDWRQLLGLLDKEMARSPHVKRQVALLEEMHVQAEEIVRERDALKASMVALTRKLHKVLRTGRTAAVYLRAAAKVEIPSGSPQRKKLGINTGGRPRGSRKAPASRK